jgi:succinate dehydrogenase / fumarate reductase cytochrome b subunit
LLAANFEEVQGTMDSTKAEAARPLSPHIQIYRPMLSMMMSIVHRITGAALYVGTLLLVVWLVAAASGPSAFATAQDIYGSWPGQIVLFGYTWALIHHALGGVRHLVWDTGHGFEPEERELGYRISLVGAIVLTVLLWIIGYVLGGSAG